MGAKRENPRAIFEKNFYHFWLIFGSFLGVFLQFLRGIKKMSHRTIPKGFDWEQMAKSQKLQKVKDSKI